MKTRQLILPTMAMLSLIGCTRDEELDRNTNVRTAYGSREECLKDWNKNPNDCQQDAVTHHYMSPWFPYYMYMQGYNSGSYRGSTGIYTAPVAGSTTSTFVPSSAISPGGRVTVSRGGFGSTGHASSGAGE